jgi:hypothetical protein
MMIGQTQVGTHRVVITLIDARFEHGGADRPADDHDLEFIRRNIKSG